jgi:D-beta-D-heptose 7-phosphate kinase/D-beta-D-heptose 1-phosphate adenosyltransferase
MNLIDELIKRDYETQARIAVVGDTMVDVWSEGTTSGCQDGCLKFSGHTELETPGGAANAARSLWNWEAMAHLLGPWTPRTAHDEVWLWLPQNMSIRVPVKRRFLDTDRVVFRADAERLNYGLDREQMALLRKEALERIEQEHWGAVLITDYDKGFLDESLIQAVIRSCVERKIPVVADAKRIPSMYRGAILKCNEDYAMKHGASFLHAPYVVTCGPRGPYFAKRDHNQQQCRHEGPEVPCRNHVGAGDCFAAHLTLALAHGFDLGQATAIAHTAGRVYVQHPFSRPPYPHELRKDYDPVLGKVVQSCDEVQALCTSLVTKKVVFTNGVFRLPHAGHAWLCDWSKRQGEVLVVAVNAEPPKPRAGEWCMSLEERLRIIASWQSVDWVIPFYEETPLSLVRTLLPQILVKGHEYAGQRIPGDEVTEIEVRFAPESPYPCHAREIIHNVKSFS